MKALVIYSEDEDFEGWIADMFPLLQVLKNNHVRVRMIDVDKLPEEED